MSLTICVVVVVLNTHDEFRKMKSTSPSTLRKILFVANTEPGLPVN